MSRAPLNQSSGMPQVGTALFGWQKPITLMKITQDVTAGLVIDTSFPITLQGTIQPLNPKELALKPEGQRAWKWLQIHCLSGGNNLDTNDRVRYNGEIFKVMANNDYSLNGYIEYHLVADFAGTI